MSLGSVLETIPEKLMAKLKRHDMLETLIKRELISEALTSVNVSPEESKSLLEQYCQHFKLKNKEALLNHIKRKGITLDELSWNIELKLRAERYSLTRFEPKAEQRFLERKDHLDIVTYSLLRLNNSHLARELYLQIAESENDFLELAAAHSTGPEKNTGGCIGPISLTKAHPKLAEKLRSHEPGELIEPFQINKWWLVARLEKYQDACFNEKMKQTMCSELFREWAQEETELILSAHQKNDSISTPA